MTTISQFKPILVKLETIIYQLENNLGVEHKPSPFAEFIDVKTKQENEQKQKVEQQPEVQVKNEQDEKKAEQPQKQTEKKEKQPQQKKEQPQKQPQQQTKKVAAPVPQDLGEFTDFVSVDIRVGELKKVWKHEESDIIKANNFIYKLYCEEIDIGGEVRQIASGLQQFVPIEEMTGLVLVLQQLLNYIKQYQKNIKKINNILKIQSQSVVVNLKPRKLAGIVTV